MERDCLVGTALRSQAMGFSAFPFLDFPFEISPAVAGQQKMN